MFSSLWPATITHLNHILTMTIIRQASICLPLRVVSCRAVVSLSSRYLPNGIHTSPALIPNPPPTQNRPSNKAVEYCVLSFHCWWIYIEWNVLSYLISVLSIFQALVSSSTFLLHLCDLWTDWGIGVSIFLLVQSILFLSYLCCAWFGYSHRNYSNCEGFPK